MPGSDVRRVDVGGGIYVTVPAPDPSSRRIPAVALLFGAALSAIALARLGLTPEGVLSASLLPVLVALAAVDSRARVLPNRIIGPAMLAVLAWQLAFFADRVPGCLLAAAGAGLFLLLPALLQPGAVGMGDVKLAALLGLALGGDVVGALLIGFLAVAPVAVALLLFGGPAARRATIPFGPFLALGAGVALLA
jgi:leader peptidase (prepilin peptidase) / N-methyltransferase